VPAKTAKITKAQLLLGLFNQKNGLFNDTSGALGISGLQPKYRFQIRQ